MCVTTYSITKDTLKYARVDVLPLERKYAIEEAFRYLESNNEIFCGVTAWLEFERNSELRGFLFIDCGKPDDSIEIVSNRLNNLFYDSDITCVKWLKGLDGQWDKEVRAFFQDIWFECKKRHESQIVGESLKSVIWI